MIKKIVCLIGIVTACLANAMSQEDIAEKVDWPMRCRRKILQKKLIEPIWYLGKPTIRRSM